MALLPACTYDFFSRYFAPAKGIPLRGPPLAAPTSGLDSLVDFYMLPDRSNAR